MWEFGLGCMEPAFTCIFLVKRLPEVFSMFKSTFPFFMHSSCISNDIAVGLIRDDTEILNYIIYGSPTVTGDIVFTRSFHTASHRWGPTLRPGHIGVIPHLGDLSTSLSSASWWEGFQPESASCWEKESQMTLYQTNLLYSTQSIHARQVWLGGMAARCCTSLAQTLMTAWWLQQSEEYRW